MKSVYVSPHDPKHFSSPVDESDAFRRNFLTRRGWKVARTITEDGDKPAAPKAAGKAKAPAKPAAPKAEPKAGSGDALPADLPHRDLLAGLEITTLPALLEVLPGLHTLKGMGPARAAEVREYLAKAPGK